MFKSKIFQYCAIASAVVAVTGAIWASNANLQSQSVNLKFKHNLKLSLKISLIQNPKY